MMYYSLNNKNRKNDMINANNKEKYLESSKNFTFVPAKDVVNSEYYKKKYIEKNIKRIKRILTNKNIRKNYNKAKSLKILNKNSIFNGHLKSSINKEIKKQIDDELNSKSSEEKKSINNSSNYVEKDSIYILKNTSNDNSSKDNINCDNNEKKIFDYNDKNNLILNLNSNLTERKNSKFKKNKNCVSFKLFTEKENITNNNIHTKKYSFNNTPSPINNSPTNRNNISIYTNLNPINTNIKLFKNITSKDNINLSKIKNKSRNVINLDFLKKKSLSYKTSIDTNINSLDKYTNRCNSILLKLVKKNKSKKKNFFKTYQDKELKTILSKKANKKYKSQFMKKRIKDEKINKMQVLIKDSFIDYDINKILKEKNNYEKLNRNNDLFRKYSMLSENLVFGDYNSRKKSGEQILISKKERKRIIRNKRLEKLRETIKINSLTINKLKNSIKIDKDKIIDFIQRKNKINNNDNKNHFN